MKIKQVSQQLLPNLEESTGLYVHAHFQRRVRTVAIDVA